MATHPSALRQRLCRTVFVSSMFTLPVTEADSQPNVVSHYEQVYISQKVCVSGPIFIALFSCFGGYYHPSKYSTLLNTLYIYLSYTVFILFIYIFSFPILPSFIGSTATKLSITNKLLLFRVGDIKIVHSM